MVCFLVFLSVTKLLKMLINRSATSLIKNQCILTLVKYCASLSTNQNNSIKNIISSFPDSETRLLKVGIIGVPNSGKSTFINYLMDRKACPTSSKVHTTRFKTRSIFTEGDAQIVFLDSPGLVNENETKKFKLENSFLKDSKNVLQEADIVGVVHDASNVFTRETLDIKVIRLLEINKNKASFLILNKIDQLKSKRKLLDITRLLTDNCINGKPVLVPQLKRARHYMNKDIKAWPYFSDIFMVSSLTGDGLREVKQYLIDSARPAKWMFPQAVWTDQTAEIIIQNSVKAKLLDFLPQEIPYRLKPELEYFDLNDKGVITTVVLIKTPSARISKLVAGTEDGRLKQIIQSVREDLQNAFKNIVKISLIMDPPADSSPT
ncbi:GTPase Era, mitochondrial [Euwallacea similis]|uniref:GTPase Era, mitochondrial n=1 Tax=Euwallacea similis TaxID=1736056 RepID=UPI00344DC218